jgi:phage shock protein PspC (stress-responsive transcriptional regulator)
VTSEPDAPTAAPRATVRRAADDQILVGVCAGLARAVDLPVSAMRIAFIVGAFVATPAAIVVYAVLALVLPREDGRALLGGVPDDATENLRGWAVVAVAVVTLLFVASGTATVAGYAGDLLNVFPAARVFAEPFWAIAPHLAALLLLAAVGAGLLVLARAAGHADARPTGPDAPTTVARPPAGPPLAAIAIGALTVTTGVVTALDAAGAIDLGVDGAVALLAIAAAALGVAAIVFAGRRGAMALLLLAIMLAGTGAFAAVVDHRYGDDGPEVVTVTEPAAAAPAAKPTHKPVHKPATKTHHRARHHTRHRAAHPRRP